MQQHQRGLTVTYFHLHEAQCVNVEPLYLCLTRWEADLASGERDRAEAPVVADSRPYREVTPLTGRRELVR